MTIWEKAVISAQKGSAKLLSFAAIFAERIRAEIELVRLRMNIDAVQKRIDDLHRAIGKRVVSLKDSGDVPKSVANLFKDEEVSASLDELSRYQNELHDLQSQLSEQQETATGEEEKAEDTAA
jgi:ArsR family metal-binding transcriptional regulator